uniref:Peptidase S1 domain-containing protein n=2 Tax=Sphaeramia orbicularis TaxID=375764 RepID=A0A673BWS1_9TELE
MEDMDDEEGNDTSEALQVVKLAVVGQNECSCAHGGRIPNEFVCAEPRADDDDDNDSSEGDLGAPMIAKNHTVWVQFGIVNYGLIWTFGPPPKGYTRVSEFQDWISGIVGNNSLPGFVEFVSEGVDSDLNFTCSTHPPPTRAPSTRGPPTRAPSTRGPSTRGP